MLQMRLCFKQLYIQILLFLRHLRDLKNVLEAPGGQSGNYNRYQTSSVHIALIGCRLNICIILLNIDNCHYKYYYNLFNKAREMFLACRLNQINDCLMEVNYDYYYYYTFIFGIRIKHNYLLGKSSRHKNPIR